MPVPADRRGMSPATVVLLLTLLLSLQPVTTDLYLPALPTLQRALGADIAAAQLTLSALILCFGVSQLVIGPLADRIGRRPVLLAGTALYAAASLAGALAGSIEALVAWRALQGIGMAAAVTCARSIVRDLYPPQDGARVMARAFTGLGVIAMASPALGGVLVQWLDWRAALAVPSLFALATLALLAMRLDETLPQPDPQALRPARLLRNWTAVVRDPTFRAWTLLSGFAYGGLFFLLAGSSFVMIEVLGLSRVGYGIAMASNALAYVAGTVWCRALLRRHGLRGAVSRGAWLSLLGGGGMALLSLAGVHTLWAILVPQWVFAIAHGVHQPCSQAGAVGPFPEKAGTAASLSGCWMMLVAFGIGALLGRTLNGTVYPMTLGIGAAGLAIFATAWTLVRWHGEAAAPRVAAAAA